MSKWFKKSTAIMAALAMVATMALPMSFATTVKAAEKEKEVTEEEFLRELEKREQQETKMVSKEYGSHGRSWDGTSVKVTIENVNNGYVWATTPAYDANGNTRTITRPGSSYSSELETIVPIGETVDVPKGAYLDLSASSRSGYKCSRIEIVKASGTETVDASYKYYYELTEDVTVRAYFEPDASTSTGTSTERRNVYYVSVSPNRNGTTGAFSGKVRVYGYDAEGKYHSNIEGASLRLNTELTGVSESNRDSYARDLALFTYDDATKTLSAANLPEVRSYYVPFVVNINGTEYATYTSGDYTYSIYAYVSVGAYFDVDMVAWSDSSSSHWKTTTWGSSFDASQYPTYRSLLDAFGEVGMYGYTLVGYTEGNSTVDKTAMINLNSGVDYAGHYNYINIHPVYRNAAGQYYYAPGENGVWMYRMYNPNSGEHLFTQDVVEADHLEEIGWDYEGTAWKAPTTGIPVYRLYNPNTGEHHYTKDVNEVNTLVSLGWNNEDVKFYTNDSGTPMYRLFNPNAEPSGKAPAAHHYTKDLNERNTLIGYGYQDENVAWYGL